MVKQLRGSKKTKIAVLFSGGKDSSLIALMLANFFDVELVTVTFGLLQNWKRAEKIAKMLKFPFKALKIDKKILEEAAKITVKDGYPNNGIKYIHQKALEETAKFSEMIADGVRRNDRVPVLTLRETISFEDRFKVHYVQPLLGISRKTVNILVNRFFEIKEYKNTVFVGAEYEFELREMIKKKYGAKKISKIFPKNHTHTIVTGIKRFVPIAQRQSEARC